MPRDVSDYPLFCAELTSSNHLVGSYKTVQVLEDFPDPIGNVITLPANSSWLIVGDLDLMGRRLVMGGNVALNGTSSETSSLSSTGLPTGEYLVTSSYTVPIRGLTFGCPVDTFVFDLFGDGSNGLDLFLTNFGSNTLVCGGIGRIGNFSNVNAVSCAFLNYSGGLLFYSSVGTIAFENSIWVSFGMSGAAITLDSTLVVSRRFRIILSSMVIFGSQSQTGILFQAGASIPPNGLILENINFSAGGTYLDGVSSTDLISKFKSCVGIQNSIAIGEFTINANIIATTVTINDWFAILGTAVNQRSERFTYLDRTYTYVGTLQSTFMVNINYSIFSGNNQNLQITFGLNGTPLDQFSSVVTTSGNGRVQAASITGVVNLVNGDLLEVYVKNTTSGASITVEYMTFTVYEINT